MFALHTLGWNSFQQLCLTITRQILGQTVESFLDSNDGGRDGAFTGEWRAAGQEDLSGRFVIQCKFTNRNSYALRTFDISSEIKKARRLVSAGRCDSYVLMTNAGVSGRRAEEIEALFRSTGVKCFRAFDSTWINQQIRENKQLRMNVPRVYGLGDLSQILDERAYVQARAILESMRENLAKVVVTSTYQKAIEAIDRHGFVLLIGEPAAGKTTIASLLAMASLDKWKASILKLDDPGEVANYWNPEEPSQFFWLDDAFGVTQYESHLVHSWNHILPRIPAMISKESKIVMTSRDYIYNAARRNLKESAFPLLKESQVVVDVQDLTIEQKRRILYNHLKLGSQPHPFRKKIKPFLEGIASHSQFIPETARRVAEPLFTKNFLFDKRYIDRFVGEREEFLQDVLRTLDIDCQAALALIYMRNGRLESPIQLQPAEREALERLGSELGRCLAALEALKGSFVLHMHLSGESIWSFKHPTIGDAYATILSQSPEHLGIFIQGTSPDKLISQVTCGDVGIERAVIVPKSLFPTMLEKLERLEQIKTHKSAMSSAFETRRAIQGFIAHRCVKDFVLMYLQANEDLVDKVSRPGLFLDVVPEVQLAQRLHEFGLLPEDKRRKFVETVSRYALEGQDAKALDDKGIRTLFTDDEFDDLVLRVRAELVPRLDDVTLEWADEYSYDGSPEDYMQPLLDLLSALKRRFGDDNEVARVIEREMRWTQDWIAEHAPEEPEIEPRRLGEIEVSEQPQSTRSIFDDIDAEDVESI